MSNSQIFIKLFIFSIVYFLLFEAARFISDEFTTGYMHEPSVWNDLFGNIGVYAAIGFGAAIGWRIKPLQATSAFLIPLPTSIYEVAKMNISGIFSQIRPNALDMFQFHIFEHSIPCLLVAIAISYSRHRAL